jgi:hypothetical protein
MGRSVHFDVENTKNPKSIDVYTIIDDVLADRLCSQTRLKMVAVFSQERMGCQPLQCFVQSSSIDQALLVSPDLSRVSQRSAKIAACIWSEFQPKVGRHR